MISLLKGRAVAAVLLFQIIAFNAAEADTLQERLVKLGELAPYPEAQPFLIELVEELDSMKLRDAIKDSRTLQMLRERLRTSLFHLNLRFEVESEKYPYRPPFSAPFPYRPTLEAIDEAEKFFSIVEKATSYRSAIRPRLADPAPFEELKVLLPKTAAAAGVRPFSRTQIEDEPVDAYVEFLGRKDLYGENASFPEFSETVRDQIAGFMDQEIESLRDKDLAFDLLVSEALDGLSAVSQIDTAPNRLYAPHYAPYPYRRTIQAIDRAILIFDLRERLEYPEGINWHDVELSWHVPGLQKKVLPLYHFNRYKYQVAGLLADHEQIMWPFSGGANFEFLLNLRVAPIGLYAAAIRTDRIDRHLNTPLDNSIHDWNHVRRMRGYDLRKMERLGITTRAQRIQMYRDQQVFMKDFLRKTEFKSISDLRERNLRKGVRLYGFETTHETALTPDIESFRYDLLRKPATRQPFEVQVQKPIDDLEKIRSFDGNLKSGADQLRLNLRQPTTVRYFYDRAPGFHANVDNKIRWGFYDSVFKMGRHIVDKPYRHPLLTAAAAFRLFDLMGIEKERPTLRELLSEMTDHSGQQELWNYYSPTDSRVVEISKLDILSNAPGPKIHDTWRWNTSHVDRFYPTNAKLIDGTHVQDDWTLQEYFKQRGIPTFLQQYFRLQEEPVSGEIVLWEDIRNLPDAFLAPNHRAENLMSGAKALSIVDRIWHRKVNFISLEQVQLWLVAAAQAVHQAVLDRNANKARNNPVYNRHWLLLPPENQRNDLNLVRIAFDARMEVQAKALREGIDIPFTVGDDQALLFREGMAQLYGKINRGEVFVGCNLLLLPKQRLELFELRNKTLKMIQD